MTYSCMGLLGPHLPLVVAKLLFTEIRKERAVDHVFDCLTCSRKTWTLN